MKNNLKNFIVLDQTDSTNNYANRLISSGMPQNGTVVLAHYQEQGRGQRENSWESERGKNMLASYILFPRFLPAFRQFYLSKAASLAIVEWLLPKISGVSVKWPNDIYAGNRKIAGILIEASVKGNELSSAVIGTGLNLNQTSFGSDLPNAVSLKMITGYEYQPLDAATEICERILKWVHLLEMESYAEVDDAYFNHLFRKNQWARYRENNNLIEARIIGIGEYGELVLEDRSGNTRTYLFKEIEFII